MGKGKRIRNARETGMNRRGIVASNAEDPLRMSNPANQKKVLDYLAKEMGSDGVGEQGIITRENIQGSAIIFTSRGRAKIIKQIPVQDDRSPEVQDEIASEGNVPAGV